MFEKIIIEISTSKNAETAWEVFTNPDLVKKWNFAASSWHCPKATSDFRIGGNFNYRMESVDGKIGFDFSGTFTQIIQNKKICYKLGDDREVTLDFIQNKEGLCVRETFDAETENSIEMQKSGWQAILDNYKKEVDFYDV